MTKWVPLFKVEALMGSPAVEAINAVIKCRRMVQVIRSPDEGHRGLWFCALVPVPKTAAPIVEAARPQGAE